MTCLTACLGEREKIHLPSACIRLRVAKICGGPESRAVLWRFSQGWPCSKHWHSVGKLNVFQVLTPLHFTHCTQILQRSQYNFSNLSGCFSTSQRLLGIRAGMEETSLPVTLCTVNRYRHRSEEKSCMGKKRSGIGIST